ncbi:MAG TPA: hypothetical protein VGL46_06285 [Pseudonocardiaceae bacterium]|jgi:hypothetical protein
MPLSPASDDVAAGVKVAPNPVGGAVGLPAAVDSENDEIWCPVAGHVADGYRGALIEGREPVWDVVEATRHHVQSPSRAGKL